MATQAALDLLGQGIESSASDARARTKGREVLNLSEADVRKLLVIAAASGDLTVLEGNRLERLGRAEATLADLARRNDVEALEMLHALQETSGISPELFEAVRDGKAVPADALAAPGRTEQVVEADAEEAQAAAEEEVKSAVPEHMLEKLAEVHRAFADPSELDSAFQLLGAAVKLSPGGRYALASALLVD